MQGLVSPPPVTAAPEPAVLPQPTSESQTIAADTSHSGPQAVPRRARSLADAGVAPVKNGAAASASGPPAAPPRRATDGGIFQEVPF
jgi:hypothetical protein